MLSRIADEQPAAFEYGFAGTCTSLGRRAAIVQFGRKDDTPVNAYLAGRLAAPLKELICRGRSGVCAARPANPDRRSGSRVGRGPGWPSWSQKP